MRATARSTTVSPVRRKSTLFCPACAHESPIDDRWVETTTATARVLACPECGAIVDSRPRRPPLPAAEAG